MMDRVKSIQRRGRPRLAFEAVAEFLGRSLDGDQPVQPSVTRLIDISHPAFAQLFEDDIGAEPRTRLQGHGCGILPCALQRPANSATTGSFLDSWFPPPARNALERRRWSNRRFAISLGARRTCRRLCVIRGPCSVFSRFRQLHPAFRCSCRCGQPNRCVAGRVSRPNERRRRPHD